ncbi:MAG: glycoside hydrolase [Verrucomicrobiota bacterium]|nr:glycoside hydrolase [Verrucomicrobiota bacterium]
MNAGTLALFVAMLAPAIVSGQMSLPASPTPNHAQANLPRIRKKSPLVDRSKLPPALQKVPLEHLSSGALMLLDHGGDLVAPPPAWPSREAIESFSENQEAASVALDLRVGGNIRLGDDPVVLPPTMRAQAEPHIARSLLNPDIILATFQEGRFATNGGAVDCGYSISRNGGLTWTRTLIPGLTQTSGGPYFRATDPVAAVDLGGNMYLNTLAATDTNFNTGVVVVSRSTNGGVSFVAPREAYRPPNNTVFPDKNWIAINAFPGTPTTGRILVTFSLFSSSSTNGAPIFRTYSDNGGVTWSAATAVNASNTNCQGSQPVFLPGGKLAIVYWNFGTASDPSERLEVVISNDGGATFGAPIRIAYAIEWSEPSIRTGVFLPSATTDRSTGNLYVVYQARFSGAPKILFTKSTNGGTTWTTPIPISDNPSNTGVFNPAIAASPDGQRLTAAFYDRRANPASTTLVDMFMAQSFDGGATWQPNIRLTSVSTNATLAPLTSQGYMLGDYLGVAETTNVNVPAVPIWVDTRTGNSDPFVARVGISAQVDFTSWQAARLSLAQINNPTLGGESGDADHDGEDNFSEFRSRTDPNNSASVVYSARELNFSTRLRVQTGNNVMIGGFIITGSISKNVILRAIGPSLTAFGISGALQDPTLELHDHTGAIIASNNNWKDSQMSEIQMTGIPPSDDRESAIVRPLLPGAYTAIIRGNGNTTGVGLVEAYDLAPTTNSKFGNISTRGLVQTGDNVMIGGFIVGGGLGTNGTGAVKVLLRGIGPSLTQSGVPGALQDPTLELHNGNGALIASNDNWRDTQQTTIQTTGIPPTDDRESAIVIALPQGNYTAVLRGKNNTTGVALVEAYNVP